MPFNTALFVIHEYEISCKISLLYVNGVLYTGPVAKTNIRQTDRTAINPQRYPRERARQNRSQLFANRSHSAPRETDILWNNQFRSLQNEDSFSNDRPYGKRKANSPLSNETENKKCNESASPSGNLSYGENSNTPHQASQNLMDTSDPIHNSPDRQNTSDQLTCSGQTKHERSVNLFRSDKTRAIS